MYTLHFLKGFEPGPIIECFYEADLEGIAQAVMSANTAYTQAILFGPNGEFRSYIYPNELAQAA